MKSAVITPCSHFFHAGCLKKWVYVQETCPLCHKQLKSQSQPANATAAPTQDILPANPNPAEAGQGEPVASVAEGNKTVTQNGVPVEESQARSSSSHANPDPEPEGQAEEAGPSQGSGESCLRHRQPQQSASCPEAASSTACAADLQLELQRSASPCCL